MPLAGETGQPKRRSRRCYHDSRRPRTLVRRVDFSFPEDYEKCAELSAGVFTNETSVSFGTTADGARPVELVDLGSCGIARPYSGESGKILRASSLPSAR